MKRASNRGREALRSDTGEQLRTVLRAAPAPAVRTAYAEAFETADNGALLEVARRLRGHGERYHDVQSAPAALAEARVQVETGHPGGSVDVLYAGGAVPQADDLAGHLLTNPVLGDASQSGTKRRFRRNREFEDKVAFQGTVDVMRNSGF